MKMWSLSLPILCFSLIVATGSSFAVLNHISWNRKIPSAVRAQITQNCQTNCKVPGNYSPIERVILHCEGNLQRVLSAYFNHTISVKILSNQQVNENTFDRKVELFVNENMKICTAESKVLILKKEIVDKVASNEIGIGQLIRLIGEIPSFELKDHGKLESGELWREYLLKNSQVSFNIREVFVKDFEKLAS